MDKPQGEFKVPIWLSNWTFRDSRNKKYTLYNQVVKGYNKGEIFTNPKIVKKLVNKIKGRRSKQKACSLKFNIDKSARLWC